MHLPAVEAAAAAADWSPAAAAAAAADLSSASFVPALELLVSEMRLIKARHCKWLHILASCAADKVLGRGLTHSNWPQRPQQQCHHLLAERQHMDHFQHSSAFFYAAGGAFCTRSWHACRV